MSLSRFKTLDELDVTGKRVLLRADLNLPITNGAVSDTTRIDRIVPTIRELLGRGAAVIVTSHLGRPGGKPDPALSLKPVAGLISQALGGGEVAFAEDCVGEAARALSRGLESGRVGLLENLRFHAEEEKNSTTFAKQLAVLGDCFVYDAFSCAHRAHASIDKIAQLLPAAAGRLMQSELEAMEDALEYPERPLTAIVGGNKIDTKLAVLGHLFEKVDQLVIGGAMANTFLRARGLEIGKSRWEPPMIQTARDIEAEAGEKGCQLHFPIDVVLADTLEEGSRASVVPVEAVPTDKMILDIGPETAGLLGDLITGSRTLVWNGPLGAFEIAPFDEGTNSVARAVARATKENGLLSVAGGGDTMAALANAGVVDKFSYVSTAGGAFLEWLQGRQLPGVMALRNGIA